MMVVVGRGDADLGLLSDLRHKRSNDNNHSLGTVVNVGAWMRHGGG